MFCNQCRKMLWMIVSPGRLFLIRSISILLKSFKSLHIFLFPQNRVWIRIYFIVQSNSSFLSDRNCSIIFLFLFPFQLIVWTRAVNASISSWSACIITFDFLIQLKKFTEQLPLLQGLSFSNQKIRIHCLIGLLVIDSLTKKTKSYRRGAKTKSH